jgi:hypothetical protein
MRAFLFSILFTVLAFASVSAQTARVQIINNSPDQPFDLYVGDVLQMDNFAFRSATPYITVPAGTVNIGIAPANSTSVADAIPIGIPFTAGGTSVMMVTGLLNGTPPFDLKSYWTASETAQNANSVGMLWYHGSPDAGTFDVIANGTKIVDDASYGYYQNYVNLAHDQVYTIDFANPTNASDVWGSYLADLGFYAGGTVTIIASGYINGQPEFEPWAVLSNGVTFPLPKATGNQPGSGMAKVQFIHNSPVTTVDIWAGDSLLINDFAYKTATPFIDVPAGTTMISIADRNSTSEVGAMAVLPLTVAEDKSYIVVAAGTLGGTPTLEFKTFDQARQEAPTLDQASVMLFHGSPDAPGLDIVNAGNVWFDNAVYGDYKGYVDINAATPYQLDVTPANDNTTILESYNLDLSFWKGRTAVIFTGPGYVNGTDPAFEPWVALSNGGTYPLPKLNNTAPLDFARIQFIHNAPTATVDVYVNGALAIDDFAYRTATPFMDIAADDNVKVVIAPRTSTSVADGMAEVILDLDAGQTYVAVATGLVGGAPAFDIKTMNLGQEAAVNPDQVDVLFFNGATDAGGFDLISANNTLFDDVDYGFFSTAYTSLDPNEVYKLDFTASNDATNIFGSYDADMAFWKGGSAVIFASGFMGGGTPAFEPWVALSNGGTYPLVIHNNFGPGGDDNFQVNNGVTPVGTFPNPATDQLTVQVQLASDMDVTANILNPFGNTVSSQNFGLLSQGDNTLQFDLATLSSGQYFLAVHTATGVQNIPFMVLKQ